MLSDAYVAAVDAADDWLRRSGRPPSPRMRRDPEYRALVAEVERTRTAMLAALEVSVIERTRPGLAAVLTRTRVHSVG